jgi:glycosyltransferase involved in cell wall biosynthesis
MAFCFSILIIAKNEAVALARTLQALQGLSDDVLVVENDSSDNTVEVAKQFGAKVYSTKWLGYGLTKNLGASYTKYNWLLSLDADEVVDQQLYTVLQNLVLQDNKTLYTLTRVMMWQQKILRFGGSVEHKVRLYHKQFAQWNDSAVHENLVYQTTNPIQIKLTGKLLHYSYTDLNDAIVRNDKYAKLDADKKFAAGKKYVFYLPKLRGWLEFVSVYILKLGWLDGKNGFEYAKSKQIYKQQKYSYLQQKYKS